MKSNIAPIKIIKKGRLINMTNQEIRTLNFSLGVQKTKQYTMKGMSQAQADGKDYINNLVREWLREYQFATIKQQIGFLKEQIREMNCNIKIANEDLEYVYKIQDKKELMEEIEKWTMVKTILTDMLSVMVGA